MIKIYFKKVNDVSIQELDRLKKGSWIKVINPTKEEINFLVKRVGVLKDFIEDALDEDERPRVDKDNGQRLIIVRIPYKEIVNGDIEIKTIPLGVIITNKYIITVCLKDEDITKLFVENRIRNFSTTQRTRFLLYTLREINKRFDRYINEMEKYIRKIEHSAAKSLSNQEILKLLMFQKTLLYFNVSIVANEKVFRRIASGKIIKLYEDDEDLLEDLMLNNEEMLESVKIFGKILSNAIDAYSSVVSNNLNMIMKTLTSITIIFSVPTIIFSAYGMNVRLPIQFHSQAFWIMWIISILWMLVMTYIFKKINWL
ncbi:MAG: magnesium transporter CorA family protein [Candidatus Aenigmarchaeota archaeon]|nr:magnesium transporter CorA family protein [Candidatus Aenigmarchaeota archaeon]